MKNLLERRDEIYGVCALWIVLFHVFRRISMPYIPVVTNVIGLGNMGVDIFLFLSGVCLYLSSDRRTSKHGKSSGGTSAGDLVEY